MDMYKMQRNNKVAIVTLQSVNYGNRLQNFALQQILLHMGLKVETFDYYESSYLIRIIKAILKLMFGKENGIHELKRIWAFYRWNRQNIIFSKTKLWYKKKYSRVNADYSCYITGSDQIWHPNMAKITLLSFAVPEKRISYAASFGIDFITDEQQSIYKKDLKLFKDISVREISAVNIVKKISGKDATHVLDPVMLIDTDIWKSVEIKPPNAPTCEYILIYSLGGIPDELNKRIMDISKTHNYPVYYILKDYYEVNPFEFLYLISHSKLFVTDSFHGTAFSILYCIPFLIFKRIGRLDGIFPRLDSLLSEFDCKNRIYNINMTNDEILSPPKPINMEFKKSKSIEFLRKNLIEKEDFDDKFND